MIFSSPFFLFVFLPAFLSLYFLMPTLALRNLAAVAMSLVFFAWGEPVFVVYVVAGTAVDHFAIRYVIAAPDRSPGLRRATLTLLILVDLGALAFFKYANFTFDQLQALFGAAQMARPGWYGVALPLGISFIVFHKISFAVDVYKNRNAPPRNLVDSLLYILFFPQLIAGPIVRFFEIGAQIAHRTHTAEAFLDGFCRFLRGLARKTLIADPAGRLADVVFSLPPEQMPAHYAWLGAFAYAVQIYFDFSGYSDMAIGLARICGFVFPENFNQPYTARSITEFWQRWHISLTNWMRVYLYIPLGGNRVPNWRLYLNLWIVFLLSGLWHGAAWTFVAWGAYNGTLLTMEKFWESRGWRNPLPVLARQAATFLLVLIGWVMFRAVDLAYAGRMLRRMFGMLGRVQGVPDPLALIAQPHWLAMAALGTVIALIRWPESWRTFKIQGWSYAGETLRWAGHAALFIISAGAIFSAGSTSFLYFRF